MTLQQTKLWNLVANPTLKCQFVVEILFREEQWLLINPTFMIFKYSYVGELVSR